MRPYGCQYGIPGDVESELSPVIHFDPVFLCFELRLRTEKRTCFSSSANTRSEDGGQGRALGARRGAVADP
jgi:hypothetical protein